MIFCLSLITNLIALLINFILSIDKIKTIVITNLITWLL